ncbi:glutamate receptor-like [Eriocheir sinensis]|uniref:glutamate receptor-like n=1 Tax=Eriocheir sinensis TaxID=95602 RepID=UPI0021C9967B|nr:glutamate receptor-like [Eriocheir sinensis]
MVASSRAVLKVAIEQWVPYTLVTEVNGTMTVGGPMGKLLDSFSRIFNVDYMFVQPPDKAWGQKYPNGSWDGMIGQLQRREVEFAVGPFGVTHLREEVCDFTESMYSENNAIFMVRPTLQTDMAGFVKPFSGTVWVLALVSLAVVVVVMAWVAAAEVRLFGSSWRWSLAKATVWGLKVFTQEGSVDVPPFDGSRLLAAVWLLASLVFMSSYGGILTAMLTVPRVTIPIDSLEDLAAQDDLPWKMEKSSMTYQYFSEAKDGVRKKVFDGLAGTIIDCWKSRHDVVSGQFAAICDRTTMKKVMSWDFSTTGKCHTYISTENVFSNIQIAMAFQTNSTYREGANQIIRSFKQAGILDMWLGAEITNVSQCLRSPTTDRSEGLSPLNTGDLAGSFLLLAGGLAAAAAAFLLEAATSLC